MNKSDELRIVEHLENEKEKLIELLPLHLQRPFTEESYVAGGSIYCAYNNKPINDIDIFVESLELKIALGFYFKRVNGLKVKRYGSQIIRIGTYKGEKLVVTDNAITIGKYQIILKDYGEPVDVVNRFDFKHNMYYIKNHKFYSVAELSYLDLEELRYNDERARDICGTIMRIPKFVERGFSISHKELSKMLLKLHEVGFSDEELEILKGKTQSQTFGSGE